MRLQVVHAHPLEDSYAHALFRAIVESARKAGHEVVETDLYRMGFDPVLNAAERRTYFDGDYDSSGVQGLADELRRAEGLILAFPTWWFGMPAILKGYFDRVWGPGIAFKHDLAGGRILPLLTNLRVFGVVTSYGSPWWLTKVVGDPGRKQLMRALRPMCGRGTDTFWLAHYDMDRCTPETRAAFLEKVRARVGRLR